MIHIPSSAELLESSKLNAADFNQTFSQRVFLSSVPTDNMVLLELDDTLERQIFAKPNNDSSQKLVLKGDESTNSFAVLCTESETYELKRVQVSNSILLTPSLLFPSKSTDSGTLLNTLPSNDYNVSLFPTEHSYIEPKRIRPNRIALRDYLDSTAYRGPDNEVHMISEQRRWTPLSFDDLLARLPLSCAELRFALSELQCFECSSDEANSTFGKPGAHVRRLEFEYLSLMLNSLINSLPAPSIDGDEMLGPEFSIDEALSLIDTIKFPRHIVCHVLRCYCDDLASDSSKLRFKLAPTARFYAQLVLSSSAQRQFALNDFLSVWRLSLLPLFPDFEPDLKLLGGLTVVDRSSHPEHIFLVPAERLAEDLSERLEQLFCVKTRWTADELHPFLSPLLLAPAAAARQLGSGTGSTASASAAGSQSQSKSPAAQQSAAALASVLARLARVVRDTATGDVLYTTRGAAGPLGSSSAASSASAGSYSFRENRRRLLEQLIL